jgi:outer membrane receptor protein involved in Fe transport
LLTAHQFVFSQEVRLATRDPQAALTWVTGVFYAHSRADFTHNTYAVIAPRDPGVYNVDYKIDTDTAVFGDAALRVAPHWRIGIGTRFGATKTDFVDYAAGFANVGALPYFRAVAAARPELTPKVSVSYDPNEANLVYASVARGYRAGGPNNPYCGVPPSYRSDSDVNFEAGTKSSLLEARLRLTTSAFVVRWTDIQQRLSTTGTCFTDYTVNSGTAVSRGFDITMDALLGGRTYAMIAGEFLDAHYLRTVRAGSDVLVQQGTAVGALPSVSPRWSWFAALEYQFPLGLSTKAFVRAEDVLRSRNPGPFLEQNPASSRFDVTEYPDPTTNLVNMHLGVTGQGWDVKLSILNVTNAQPLLQHDSDASGSTLQYAYTFRPRTVALSATKKF